MFEKFTDRARRIVVLAQNSAQTLSHDSVRPEHLLLGLLEEGESIATQALVSLGISLEMVRRRVEATVSRNQKIPPERVPWSPEAKKALELALRESLQLNHNYIGTEHILLGLIRESTGIAAQVLVELGADLDRTRRSVIQVLSEHSSLPAEPAAFNIPHYPSNSHTSVARNAFSRYGRNLTLAAQAGKLDPVVGREKEIERIIQVLSLRTKNNPVLVGRPGVGKTAVVHGLARAIAEDKVPETLQGRLSYALDLGMLADGAHSRRDIAERVRVVLDVIDSRSDMLLFVDQIHAVFGPNATETGTAVGAALKPMLAQGRIQMIGAGPSDASGRYPSREVEAEFRLQPIHVAAPSVAHTVEILKSKRDRIESHHRVSITDGALVAAATLADRYISDRFLPDKAIDLIDEAGSRLRIRLATVPPDLHEFDEQIAVIRQGKEAAIDVLDFEKAAALRDQEEQLLVAKAQWEKAWKASDMDIVFEVDEALVAEVLVSVYGIQPGATELTPDTSFLIDPYPASPSAVFLTDEDREIWAMS